MKNVIITRQLCVKIANNYNIQQKNWESFEVMINIFQNHKQMSVVWTQRNNSSVNSAGQMTLWDSLYMVHTVYFWREMLIKKHPFKCTSIWTSIIKRLWRGKKMFKVTLKLQRYFVIYIRSPLKMQKIIKQTSPSR